jgi:hypothetical protein
MTVNVPVVTGVFGPHPPPSHVTEYARPSRSKYRVLPGVERTTSGGGVRGRFSQLQVAAQPSGESAAGSAGDWQSAIKNNAGNIVASFQS